MQPVLQLLFYRFDNRLYRLNGVSLLRAVNTPTN